MNSPIQEILTAFSMAYKEKSQKVIALVAMYMADGYSVPDAVDKAMQTAAVSSFFTEAVHTAIQKAASVGAGSDIPLLPELTGAWDASGMTLSAKLHGAETEMRQAIISTIQAQQRLGASATQAARALYDGYNSGHIIRRQPLPQYLNTITAFTRRSDLTYQDRTALQRLIRRARRQTEIMSADGVPNKSLQTAYRQLLDAVEANDTVAMENAVRTAVEEKSRYVAERIARTESARAWADGFHARYDTDDDVAAYKWTLSSRHPHYDICDMYAQADLWGLGPGIFPKDKTPILPVHPHCLCHLSLVYVTEIDKSRQRNQIRNGGDAYLKRQSHQKRCDLLGIDGARAWEKGRADWRQYMRNWSDELAKSRIRFLSDYTGARNGAYNDTNDPYGEKRYAHAKRYYDTLQHSNKNDVIYKIAQNSHFTEKSIEKIYRHVFEDEHLYKDGSVRKFYPDYYMARSFQHLYTGQGIENHDIIMLKHERLEYELMNRYGINVYETAHALAERKYNYSAAIAKLIEKEK